MEVQAKFCHWEFQVPEDKKDNRELKKRRFWATHVNIKWLMPFLFYYALTLVNLCCQVAWLYKRNNLPETQLVMKNQPIRNGETFWINNKQIFVHAMLIQSLTLNILLIWSISDLPGKSGFIVNNSANIQPTDHRSMGVEYSYNNKEFCNH